MKSFKQFSEAYTFVPKSEAELTDNQDLLSLYHAVMQMTGSMMPDPLAIDSKSMKKVKVHRMLDDYVNLPSLKKQFPSFKLDFGNGSRGGTGVGNAGIGFEGDFVSDVEKYIEAGLDGDFKRKKFGSILDIIPLADDVIKIKAICTECMKNDAIFTHRLSKETTQTIVGGSELYKPLCRFCYNKLN